MAGPICDACRAIDFEKVLDKECEFVEDIHQFGDDTIKEMTLVDITLDADAGRLFNASRTDCPLCQLLASTATVCSSDRMLDPRYREAISRMPCCLTALSFHEHCPWVPQDLKVKGAQAFRMLIAMPGNRKDINLRINMRNLRREAADTYVACLPKNRQPGLFVPQMISETFDHTTAKLWVQNCNITHTTACNTHCEAVSGLKAINCETLRIVPIETGALWVALSYVWGHNKSESSSDEFQS